jgi:putative hydrolase of the HAD superfamily
MNKLIILDLDDTVFETESITHESVNSILEKFKNIAIHKYGSKLINQIISEFWKFPFDFIAEKYQFDDEVKLEFAKSISKANFTFNIKPYKDFEIFKSIGCEKILVTTGFEKLQLVKINSLGIKELFSEIYIDDILDLNRIYKKGIFAKILNERNIEHDQVYIIGDNPESEIKAGYELGLQTIQVVKLEQKKSKYANYIIQDFNELTEIIN